MKQKLYTTLLLLMLPLLSLRAQESSEFQVWGGGGVAMLRYNPYQGEASRWENGGAVVGFGYQQNLSPNHWQLLGGVELMSYSGGTTLASVTDSYLTPSGSIAGGDPQKDNFLYTAQFKNLKEQQTALYLNIPLMIRYQYSAELPLYLKGGVKIGIPLAGNFTTTATELATTGYFEYDHAYFDNLPDYGFGTTPNYRASGTFALRCNIALAAEVGYRWALGERYALYGGLYVDYGVADIRSRSNTQPHLIEYNTERPALPIQHSLLEITPNNQSLSAGTMNRLDSFTLGIKLTFGWNREKPCGCD